MEKKQGKKGVKIALIILLIFILLLIGLLIYRYIVFKDVVAVNEKNIALTNFSYTMNSKISHDNEEKLIEMNYWVKDNVAVMKTTIDGEVKLLDWENSNTKERLLLSPANNKILETEEMENVIYKKMPNDLILNGMQGKELELTFNFAIQVKNTNLEGKECYLVEYDSHKSWIEKQTGYLLKRELGEQIDEYTYSVNTVTEKDIQKPSTQGYNK